MSTARSSTPWSRCRPGRRWRGRGPATSPSVEVYVGTLDDVPPVPDLRRRDRDRRARVRRAGARWTRSPTCPSCGSATPCSRTGGTLVVADREPARASSTSRALSRTTPNRPFDSLEGYALESPARTFPRRALEQMLGEARVRDRGPRRLPRLQAAAGGHERHAVPVRPASSSEAMPRFPSPDYLVPRLQLADEALTWRTPGGLGRRRALRELVHRPRRKGDGTSLWRRERHAVLFNSERQPRVRGPQRDPGHGRRAPLRAEPRCTPSARRRWRHDRRAPAHAWPRTEPVVRGRELAAGAARRAGPPRPSCCGRWAALVPDEEWAPVDLVPHNVVADRRRRPGRHRPGVEPAGLRPRRRCWCGASS